MKSFFCALSLLFCLSFADNVQGQIITPGTTTLCVGTGMALTDLSAGGIWSSGATTIAIVGFGTGIVTGVAAGTVTISYTAGVTTSTIVLKVEPAPYPIISPYSLCVGIPNAFLIDSGGNSWSSSNTSILTVDSFITFPTGVSLEHITALSAGTTTVTFTTFSGCIVTKTITVAPSPKPITGPAIVCAGTSVTMSDTVAGGFWYSQNDTIASVDSVTGFLTAHAKGGVAIIYTTGSYGCEVIAGVTVSSKPDATAMSEGDSICFSQLAYWTNFSADTVLWASSDPSVISAMNLGLAADFTGVSLGVATVTASARNSCGVTDTSVSLKVVDCHLGIVQAVVDAGVLSLLPNPSRGEFTLNLRMNKNEPVRVVISNMLGQKVKEFTTITNNAFSINMDQPSGVYLVSAYTKQGRHDARLIVE